AICCFTACASTFSLILALPILILFFFFQAEDGIRDFHVTGVQTCALPICGATAFLAALAERLHARLRDVPRLTGAPHSPEASLRTGQGSCRDFAVLFVSCCRPQGIAARFVSGYLPAPPGEAQHTPRWAEVL